MTSTSNKYVTSKNHVNRHLLIDGYNIIHAWPKLKALLNQFGTQKARDALADHVRLIHDIEHIRVTLVFDGQGTDFKIDRPNNQETTFSCLYTPTGMTADTIIEQITANIKKGQEIIVASDDHALRNAVHSHGASLISASNLMDWIQNANRKQKRALRAYKTTANKKWKNNSPFDTLKNN